MGIANRPTPHQAGSVQAPRVSVPLLQGRVAALPPDGSDAPGRTARLPVGYTKRDRSNSGPGFRQCRRVRQYRPYRTNLLPSLARRFPFFLAVIAVGYGIWQVIRWLYQWRYDGVIEQLNAMLRLAAEDNRIQKARQAESDALAKKLTAEIETKRAEAAPDFKSVSEDLSKLRLAVESAGRANTAVDETLRRGATLAGSSTFIASSSYSETKTKRA
jgi:hypothetical protein